MVLPSGVITALGNDDAATGRRGPLVVPAGVIRAPSLITQAAGRLPRCGPAGPGPPGPPSTAGTTKAAAPSAATLPTVARVRRRRRRTRPARRAAAATGPIGGSAATADASSSRRAISSIRCRLLPQRASVRPRGPSDFRPAQLRPELVQCARTLALDVARSAAQHLGGLINAQ